MSSGLTRAGRFVVAEHPESSHTKGVSDATPIRPAATVIVLRDTSSLARGAARSDAAGLEVLLVQRAGGLAFHGGAWVFPGGRVEPDELRANDSLRAARLSAVRETREEAGLALDPDELIPFSHWTTPEGLSRRFSTWFFLAQVEPHLEAVVDGGEIHAHRWLSPSAAIAARGRAEIELPPPTFVSLTVLADFASAEQALALARGREPPVFVPRPRPVEGGQVSLFPGDAAYEGGALDQAGVRHRLWMLGSGYRYER